MRNTEFGGTYGASLRGTAVSSGGTAARLGFMASFDGLRAGSAGIVCLLQVAPSHQRNSDASNGSAYQPPAGVDEAVDTFPPINASWPHSRGRMPSSRVPRSGPRS